jgi:hypothetical protein
LLKIEEFDVVYASVGGSQGGIGRFEMLVEFQVVAFVTEGAGLPNYLVFCALNIFVEGVNTLAVPAAEFDWFLHDWFPSEVGGARTAPTETVKRWR